MNAICCFSPPRASSCVRSLSLVYAMLLACAGLLAVQAQLSPRQLSAAKLKSPRPKSKSPPSPMKLMPRPPSPAPMSPPPLPKASRRRPPPPIKSRPSPKKTKSPPVPNIPPSSLIIEPFFCETCVTVYGNTSTLAQILQFTDEDACMQIAGPIMDNIISTLGSLRATIPNIEISPPCSSGTSIEVCSSYYHWNPAFADFSADPLAKDSLNALVAAPGWSCSGGTPAGTPITLIATIEPKSSWGGYHCPKGYSSMEYVCP
ncbi:hypothetical protein Vretimale_17411 [Volvox reticuliferus]|uniref:Uncharacterized protein n=2 Tax=Volvox reticuliferus TaxID=1737510 RepID=A0A8J4GV70_9CHLO|nr:hypothetical protein Vretimale_17411 [Volvox reticuliferus]